MTKNTLRRAASACAAAFVLAALSHSAHAQVTAAQQSAMRANCRSDFMSHCSGVTPGGEDALACLQKNVESLSPGCQAAVRATLPPPTQAVAPPPPATHAAAPAAAPVDSPPAATAKTAPVVSAPPPHAKVSKPAPRHPVAAAAAPVQLAPPPAAAPAAPTAGQQNAMRSHCRNDFMSHCRGVTPGGKDALACLQKNANSLSAGCRTVVMGTMHAPAEETARPVAVAPEEPAPPPSSGPGFQRPVPRGSLLVAKACARYLLMHCRGVEPGSGRAIACLTEYVNAGHFVGPRCRAVLKMTSDLR